jgi:hypothetical protein
MAFVSDDPEISLEGVKDGSYLLAHSKKGFLGVSSFRGGLSRSHIERFLKTVNKHAGEFKRLNLYGSVEAVQGIEDLGLPVAIKENREYPACFEHLGSLSFKQFSIKPEHGIVGYTDIVMRSVIYILIAYGLSLFISGMHYEAAGREIKI